MSYRNDYGGGDRRGGYGSGGSRFSGNPRPSFGGGGRGGGRFGGGGRGGSRSGFDNPGQNLKQVSWDSYTLVPFEKHFYNPHPNIANTDPRDVEQFRTSKEISIQRYEIDFYTPTDADKT